MITEIEVERPVRTVYDQWTQFEDFPQFMDHVKSVEQLDERTLRWQASIVGIKREWTAEITEQAPDQRVAWTALDGTKNSGVVTFHPLSDERTKVVLQLEMDPEGFLESVADWGGFVSDRAKKDLKDFKAFIESRTEPTGAYRGRIDREPDRDANRRRERYEAMSDDELFAEARGRDIPHGLDEGRAPLVEKLLAYDDQRTDQH